MFMVAFDDFCKCEEVMQGVIYDQGQEDGDGGEGEERLVGEGSGLQSIGCVVGDLRRRRGYCGIIVCQSRGSLREKMMSIVIVRGLNESPVFYFIRIYTTETMLCMFAKRMKACSFTVIAEGMVFNQTGKFALSLCVSPGKISVRTETPTTKSTTVQRARNRVCASSPTTRKCTTNRQEVPLEPKVRLL